MTCELAIFSIWQRCGSTLLQRMASRRPHTLVWGESARWPSHFATLLRGLQDFSVATDPLRPRVLRGERPTIEADLQLLANLTPEFERCEDGVVAAMQGFFATTFRRPEFERVGFKEVRIDNLAIRLFCRAFPDSDVIFLVRDPIDIWRSLPVDWIDYQLEEFMDFWNAAFALYQELSRADERCHLLHFEDVVARDRDTLQKLERILGVDSADLLAELELRSYSTAKAKPPADEALIAALLTCSRYRRREVGDGSAELFT